MVVLTVQRQYALWTQLVFAVPALYPWLLPCCLAANVKLSIGQLPELEPSPGSLPRHLLCLKCFHMDLALQCFEVKWWWSSPIHTASLSSRRRQLPGWGSSVTCFAFRSLKIILWNYWHNNIYMFFRIAWRTKVNRMNQNKL